MKTQDYLDAVKSKHLLTSDYRLAKTMGWSMSRVSGYRNGRSKFDEAACLAIAEKLEISPLQVIADINAERAKESQVQRFWQDVAKSAGRNVAAFAITAVVSMLYAYPAKVLAQSLYIMANRENRPLTGYAAGPFPA